MNYHPFGDKSRGCQTAAARWRTTTWLPVSGSAHHDFDPAGRNRQATGPGRSGGKGPESGGGRRPCGERGAGGGRGAGPAPIPLAVGDYTVTLEVAGEKLTKPARVRERIK